LCTFKEQRQTLKITVRGGKILNHLLETDTNLDQPDPDRHALDADADTDPVERWGFVMIPIRIHNTNGQSCRSSEIGKYSSSLFSSYICSHYQTIFVNKHLIGNGRV